MKELMYGKFSVSRFYGLYNWKELTVWEILYVQWIILGIKLWEICGNIIQLIIHARLSNKSNKTTLPSSPSKIWVLLQQHPGTGSTREIYNFCIDATGYPHRGWRILPPPTRILLISLRFKLNGTDVVKRFAKKVHFYSWIGFSSVVNLLLLCTYISSKTPKSSRDIAYV